MLGGQRKGIGCTGWHWQRRGIGEGRGKGGWRQMEGRGTGCIGSQALGREKGRGQKGRRRRGMAGPEDWLWDTGRRDIGGRGLWRVRGEEGGGGCGGQCASA